MIAGAPVEFSVSYYTGKQACSIGLKRERGFLFLSMHSRETVHRAPSHQRRATRALSRQSAEPPERRATKMAKNKHAYGRMGRG